MPETEAAPVLITGMHRTGTSMVAKALHLAGLYLGRERDLIEAAPDNPSGFYEHAGFVRLDDDLLAATGGAWIIPEVRRWPSTTRGSWHCRSAPRIS